MTPKLYDDPLMDCVDENCLSYAAVNLRECFRLLWEQHVYWTRMTIISIAADSPDLVPTSKRLLRNASDFAQVFCKFYGNRAASKFKELLTDHLVIAAEIVTAAKEGNTKGATGAERRWYKNGDEIICFLNHINSYWPCEYMREMWFEHLALTKSEAVARLNHDYTKDIAIFDQVEKQALMMADDFSTGIINQFGL